MVGRTKHQTKDDRQRMDALVEIGCIPCLIERAHNDATIQHVTSAGRRHTDQHRWTYGSCPWHHQGISAQIPNPKIAAEMYGPSFAHNKRAFAERYGTEEQLVQIADALVREVLKARRDGWFLTQRAKRTYARDLHAEIVLGRRPSDEWKSATA